MIKEFAPLDVCNCLIESNFNSYLAIFRYSRWSLKGEKSEYAAETTSTNSNVMLNGSDHNESSEVEKQLMSWSPSADYIVILILLLALAIKFIFFEDRNDMVARQLKFRQEEREENVEGHFDNNPDNTMNMSLRQRFGISLPAIQQSVFPLSGTGDGWIEVDNDVEYADKEVQTQDINDSIDENDLSLKKSEVPRSIEDCLEIYKSEVRLIFTHIIIITLHNSVMHALLCSEKEISDSKYLKQAIRNLSSSLKARLFISTFPFAAWSQSVNGRRGDTTGESQAHSHVSVGKSSG